MDGGFNLIDFIIFALVGLFIYTRFFGHKLPKGKKRPGRRKGAGRTSASASEGNILDFRMSVGKSPLEKSAPKTPKNAPKTGVKALKALDNSFKESDFLKGAKSAFGLYYEALNDRDEDMLDDLLGPALFDKVMDDLEANPPKVKATLTGAPKIADARVGGRTLIVDVQYTAEMQEGTKKPKKMVQIWTWARAADSDDPNWELDAISQPS